VPRTSSGWTRRGLPGLASQRKQRRGQQARPVQNERVADHTRRPLLVDEADSLLRDKEEPRGILNSGHTGEAAYVLRSVGDEKEPRRFSTWAAKAAALIGRLVDTLADRSLVVPMGRSAAGEHDERLRLHRPDGFDGLRRRAAADRLGELRGADPEVPGGLR